MSLSIADILDAARSGRESVAKLCAELTAEQLRAEIERIGALAEDFDRGDIHGPRNARLARAALETEWDRRTVLARTPPELRP